MRLFFRSGIGIGFFFLGMPFVFAVPPPDFLFQIGSQVGIIFSVLVILFSSMFGLFLTYAKGTLGRIRKRPFVAAIIILVILGSAIAGAYFYVQSRNQALTQEWLNKSKEQNPDNSLLPAVIPAQTGTIIPLAASGSIESSSAAPSIPELPLVITDSELRQLTTSGQPFILDAREDEEVEIGRYPGSTHIRFADLLAGRWSELPGDQRIIVFCWSGIRGKEVAEFLRSQGLKAQYVEKGASGWVVDGGAWDGNIHFRDIHSEEKYRIVFTTDQVKSFEKDGVRLVDSRPVEKYTRWHIPGSISIPIIHIPSAEMDATLGQISKGSRVITVCDDFVSCFDATVAGLKFERRGVSFLGRYNVPWEYRNSL